MCHIDLRHRLEQLAGQMSWISVASRRHVYLCRIRLGIGNEFGKRLGRNGWMHQHDQGSADHANHRNVADEIEIELVIQCRVDCGSSVKPEKRIAISWRTYHCFGGNIAGRACPVLDYDWLSELLCERLSHQADKDVGASTGWIAYHPAYGSRWIDLRPSSAGSSRQRGSARGQLQEVAAWKLHGFLPGMNSDASRITFSFV